MEFCQITHKYFRSIFAYGKVKTSEHIFDSLDFVHDTPDLAILHQNNFCKFFYTLIHIMNLELKLSF